MTEVQRVCAECGAPYPARPDGGGRCEACSPVKDRQPARAFTGGPRGRGYTARWDRLSKRARELQPFCLDCGTSDDLTADHTPEAWQRYEAGKSIRLQDIDVVCRPCNGRRGAARGEQLGAGRVRFDRSDQQR